jgi:hypothetical protein
MRGDILIVFCQFGLLWSSQVLVEQLAAVVEDEGAGEVVRELATVLDLFGEDRNILTREIRSLLKRIKDKNGRDERIIPSGIVKLLKGKMTVGKKRTILGKILNIIDFGTEHHKKEEGNNLIPSRSLTNLETVQPTFPTFLAVNLTKNTSLQAPSPKLKENGRNQLPELHLITTYLNLAEDEHVGTNVTEDIQEVDKESIDEPSLANKKPTYYQTFVMKMRKTQTGEGRKTAKDSKKNMDRTHEIISSGYYTGITYFTNCLIINLVF